MCKTLQPSWGIRHQRTNHSVPKWCPVVCQSGAVGELQQRAPPQDRRACILTAAAHKHIH